MGNYTIATLPGDGIGPEVTEQAVRVLNAVAQCYGHTFTFRERLVGLAAIKAEGIAISDETFEICRSSDAVLFGAVGSLPRTSTSGVRPGRGFSDCAKSFNFLLISAL